MSWWDDLVKAWNTPAFTPEQSAQIKKVMPQISSEITKASQTGLPSFYAAEKAADTLGYGEAFRGTKQAVSSAVMEPLATPARWTMEQYGAGALWATTNLGGKQDGLSFQEARNLVQGDRTGKEWWQSGEGGISMGQAAYGFGSAILPGKQGTDGINWTNKDEVQKYFSSGPQQYVSGYFDLVGNVFLDPTLWAGIGASKFRIKYMQRPVITGQDAAMHAFEIDQALAGKKSSWGPLIRRMQEKPSEFDILQNTFVFESSDPQSLAKGISMALESGDAGLFGDLLKASISNKPAIDRLIARRDKISGLVQARQHVLDRFDDQLLELSDTQIGNITNSLEKLYKENAIIETSIGTEGRAVGSAGGSMRRTVSSFESVETLRAKVADARGKTVYSSKLRNIGGIPVRTITWLNPSGSIADLPSGVFRLAGASTGTSYREMQAVLRQLGKDLTPLAERKLGKRADSMVFRGKTRTFEDITSEYVRIPDESKHEFLLQLQNDAIYAMVESHLKRIGFEAPTKSQISAAKIFAESVAKSDNLHRAQALADLVRNKYFTVDKVTRDTFHYPQFEAWMNEEAAMRGISHDALAKQIEDNPQLSSQMANIFSFIDTKAFSDVLLENRGKVTSLLNHLATKLSNIEEGLAQHGLSMSAKELEKELSQSVTDALGPRAKTALTAAPGDSIMYGTKAIWDGGISLYDSFQSTIWKPITLISGKYAIRNVLEAHIRSLAYFEELHSTTGVSRGQILEDWIGLNEGEGVAARVKMISQNLESKKSARAAAKELETYDTAFRAAAEAQDVLVEQSLKVASKQADKVSYMAKRLFSYKDKTKSLEASGILDILTTGESLVTVRGGVETVYTRRPIFTFKNGEVRRYLTLMFEGKLDDASKLLAELKDVSSFNAEIKSFQDHLIANADTYTAGLADGTYAAWLPKNQVALIAEYQQDLVALSSSLDTVSATRATQAAAWGDYAALAAGANPILVRSGEGFIVREGATIPDWAADQIGKFARGESSADNTYLQTVLSSNRSTLENAFGKKYRNVDIVPTDKDWVNAYSHFANTDLFSDQLAQMAMRGSSEKEMIDWLASVDGKSYRINFGIDRPRLNRSELRSRVQTVSEIVDQYLPEIPDMPPAYLKTLAAEGALTPEIAANIPVKYRSSVIGDQIGQMSPGDLLVSAYRRAVGNIFKWIGTVPETVLARHPFYRTTYRSEATRLARVFRQQGADLLNPETIDRIRRLSHKQAMKTLNETLYTIERKTDVAGLIRFASPFYMAQQNSSRYWLGQAFKNPYLADLYLLAWNTPNRVFDVMDAEGNSVESSLPFYSNEQIYITAPGTIFADWMYKLTGNEYVTVSKSSMDLITNGNIPMVPSLSGGLVSMGVGALMSGTNVQKWMMDMGFEADFIETKMLPYMDTYGGISSNVPRPAWANALVNAFAGTPQSASRVNLIFEQKNRKADLENRVLNEKELQKSLEDSLAEAKKSYLLEALFAVGSPFSTKLTNHMDLIRKEYNRYVHAYGPIDGPIKAAQEMGVVTSVYARSSLSENPGGLIATPQTEYNLRKYMGLAKELTNKNENAIALLGAMFNEGNIATDYSPVTNSHYYDMDINGQKLKDKNEKLAVAQRRREASIGWAVWIPWKENLLLQAESAGLRPNSKSWKEQVTPILQQMETALSAKYPAWADDKSSMDTKRVAKNLRAVNYIISNKEFMSDIGKKNPIWKAAKEWMQIRNTLAGELLRRKSLGLSYSVNAQDNEDIVDLRDKSAKALKKKYPGFTDVYERFLANDALDSVVG